MESSVWQLSTDILNRADNRAQFEAILRPERRLRLAQLQKEEDRLRCITAGLLFQLVMTEYGIDAKTVELLFSKHGKPSVKNGGIHFNLSHSGNCVLMAVSEQPVGVDVEKRRSLDVGSLKRSGWLQESELDGGKTPVELWVQKEAVLKMLDAPIYELRNIRIDEVTSEISFHNAPIAATVQSFSPSQDYWAALCVQAKPSKWSLLNAEILMGNSI